MARIGKSCNSNYTSFDSILKGTPLLRTYSTTVPKNHGITAVLLLSTHFLTLYLSSKQLRASGALGLNTSGRYLRAKERLEASWVSP